MGSVPSFPQRPDETGAGECTAARWWVGYVCGLYKFPILPGICVLPLSCPMGPSKSHQPKAGVQDLPFWNLKAGYAPAEAESLGHGPSQIAREL